MIGPKLRNARTSLNLTQEEVAEKIQISRQTLSNWENEKTYPDIVSIVRLSELYGVSLDSLLKDDEKILRHMEESMDMVKSTRMLVILWLLGPLIFVFANLLTGGIVIGENHFSIHGPAFFYMLILVIALSLISLAVQLAGLFRRKAAAGNKKFRDVLRKSDLLRISMASFFLLAALVPLLLLLFWL